MEQQAPKTEQNFFHHDKVDPVDQPITDEQTHLPRKIETATPEMLQNQKMHLIRMNSGSLSPNSLMQKLPTIEQE